ncbi:serine hydrolase domain-containing protein [Aquimarina megaterium]|uniref:serine hydrolase domain-containing protein n=1 Tax=Aquimarina megaterium TaxID=1443666 RepID=UPI0009F60A65|nr:serine hydrolase domain-containing protein [Aquimarina megaterium]
MNTKIVYILVLSITLFSSTTNQKTESETFIRSFNGNHISKSKMDTFIKKQMDSLNIPGLSIAFVNDDKIVYHNALGVKNMETKETVDSSTMFDAASMSKTVFSFFVMKMVDDNILDLDTPLYTYMEYPDIAYDERYKLITARMVLSHTSGFPNWRYLDNQGNYNPKGKLAIQFEPGTKFQYSGEGYEYLAKVIAYLKGVEKNELQDLIKVAVFQPLAMKNSSFVWNDYIEKHRANGHFKGTLNKGYSSSAKDPNFKASASLQTESKEFSNFVIALMNAKIVSEKNRNELLKIQSRKLATKRSKEQKYGLGIAIEESDYGTNYSHGGDNLSNTALYMFNLEKKVGYVFFTNSENRNKFQMNLLKFLLTN